MWNAYEDDCYYEANFPELDELITETCEKIKSTILESSKEEIDKQLHLAEQKQKTIDNLNSSLSTYRKNIDALNRQMEQLNQELEKKKTEIPSFKFNVGEEVYVPREDYNQRQILYCPVCKGKGKIVITTEEYGEIKTDCPRCNGLTYVHYGRPIKESIYETIVPYKSNIKELRYTLTKEKEEHKCYSISNRTYEEGEVFSTREECLKYCEAKTKENKEIAQKKLDGEWEK